MQNLYSFFFFLKKNISKFKTKEQNLSAKPISYLRLKWPKFGVVHTHLAHIKQNLPRLSGKSKFAVAAHNFDRFKEVLAK